MIAHGLDNSFHSYFGFTVRNCWTFVVSCTSGLRVFGYKKDVHVDLVKTFPHFGLFLV